ncbi:hypothetical protein MIND_01006100 [Mycena indigotica]|uniref:Cytokinin riboside 5'-monophosphate phosphoribohydrolase n=1 Tax=Mycena indigotica TaxID=2126181 RepID=A0A8H6S9J9_9AGAR|nr:uncharacterized protein MIND_01006100 [Mycena indigotica]KAF7294690.1 hypothetical protein MIND_01006100 [Mycena indigotica]
MVSNAIAVYCGSSMGTHRAFSAAAISVGHAIAAQNRQLVYGGGNQGLMGVVSGAVIQCGGKVTGVVPYAMVGGESEKAPGVSVDLNEVGRERIEHVVVNSMHERKVEMAQRVGGFIGLPGGFGTYEEVLEVTTWTQLGIHNKPVVLVNALGFYEPLRQLVDNGIKFGFIKPNSRDLIIFVDGPSSYDDHETFDWGTAALAALNTWKRDAEDALFKWTETKEKKQVDPLQST